MERMLVRYYSMWRLVRFVVRKFSFLCLFLWVVCSVFLYLMHLSSIKTIHEAHKHLLPAAITTRLTTHDNVDQLMTDSQPPSVHRHHYGKALSCVYLSTPTMTPPIDSYKSVKLVFYKKHKMSAAVSVAHKRGWLTRIARSYDSLLTYISDNTFILIFTSSKELSTPLLESLINKPNILAMGIPGAYQYTGAKREQYITYQSYLHSHGCSIEQLKLMPSIYLLDNETQCHRYFEQISTDVDRKWVLKSSRGYGGDQIEVVRNTSTLRTRFGSCVGNQQYIVQEYIQDLLLLNNRKFDIRALVLIANTRPYMVFYHEGYLRVATRPFDPKGPRDVHLTNTHVQSLQPGFSPEEHFWSFDRFQRYLDQHYPDNNDFVKTKLIPYIKKASLIIIRSGIHLLERSSSTIQLLGLDLMVSRDWHTWFIESNNYPLWPQGGGWMTQFTAQMGEDLFDLVLEVRQRPSRYLSMTEGEWFRSWQLIWRENTTNCLQNDSFDPCYHIN